MQSPRERAPRAGSECRAAIIAAWPPPADPSTGTLYIDPRAADLLDVARPSSTIVRSRDVEIAFDGALTDRDRIGAAIELAAWWACDSHAAGPYR